MDLLADDLTDEASEVARVLKLYEDRREPMKPRRRNGAAAGSGRSHKGEPAEQLPAAAPSPFPDAADPNNPAFEIEPELRRYDPAPKEA